MDKQDDIRWLRIKLQETVDKKERENIIKQLELLEAKELVIKQTLLKE